ncbi:hypothetical protein L208DRAFT_1397879 [Tricholoma matsutake]|nr:hypothetical protein L208DRAFT_1397879 [Tricholoma matsutake 945]
MTSGDRSCTYVHTEDNQNNRFQPCEPQIFRLGDIIQAQLVSLQGYVRNQPLI